jgi:hypothetical protein
MQAKRRVDVLQRHLYPERTQKRNRVIQQQNTNATDLFFRDNPIASFESNKLAAHLGLQSSSLDKTRERVDKAMLENPDLFKPDHFDKSREQYLEDNWNRVSIFYSIY